LNLHPRGVGRHSYSARREGFFNFLSSLHYIAQTRDTKMEFGLDGDSLILIDELLTPDSSRFWDARLYKVGQSQPSYDKQPVRDWLAGSGGNKEPPAPILPPEGIEATTRRYRHAYERLTGKKLG